MSIVNASDKGYWSKMTFQFIKENVNDETEVLDLTGNHVNEESAEYIARLLKKPDSNLRALSLVQTRLNVTSATLIFTALGESKLHELIADDNIFNAEVCQSLSASLQKNPPLELLSLCGCDIPTYGFVHIASALPHCHSLNHLRLESNSAFSPGIKALAEVIPRSNLMSLSVADNQIWADGISALLGSIQSTVQNPIHIYSLDISYNIVDARDLSEFIVMSQIQELAISGIKIEEQGVVSVLEAIQKSRLHRLIFDGFNSQVLPVSWPRAQDNPVGSVLNFQHLQNIILNCPNLVDMRFGFLTLQQIRALRLMRIDRQLAISLHNFGKTDNCWVIRFNYENKVFSIDAPTTIFQWKDEIAMEDVSTFTELVKIATFAGKPIDTVDLSQVGATTKSNKQVISSAIAQLTGFDMKSLNLSGVSADTACLNALISILPETQITELEMQSCVANEESLCSLLEFYGANPHRAPRRMLIGFTCVASENVELAAHRYAEALALLLSRDESQLEELVIAGPITANDVATFALALSDNHVLKTLKINSDYLAKYRSPDPELEDSITQTFVRLVDVLYEQISPDSSRSVLSTFQFPLLTEVFLYNDANYEKWQKVDQKIEENRDQLEAAA